MKSCRKIPLRRGSVRTEFWVWLWFGCLAFGMTGPSFAASRVQFNRDIRPLLSDNCFNCHGPDAAKRKAGLQFDQREGALQRLKSGNVAIVPGKPDESRMIAVITTSDEDDRMPPVHTGKTLSKSQVAVLRQWIEEGAEWQPHWAYLAPERPALPAVTNVAWPRQELDRFILSRLEQEGLAPAPEADRRTLIRRVSFDLTGLPPTPEEVDQFLADPNPDAYEKLTDRLLASQAFGERMAVQWLDLARYADSDGYHADAPRSMWQYRDYVIQAFNRNLPFDQFIVEQLAGDLLPEPTLEQRIATAFNRNGMSSTEGGADPDEYMNKYVTDRVNTFGTVFLGSTLQCAECHSHKYDPFTQREYYALYDFFNRIPERGLDSDPAPPFVKVPTEAQRSALEKAQLDVRVVRSVLDEALASERPDWVKAQEAWEREVRAGTPQLTGLKLGAWRSVGPFSAASGAEAFKQEFGPEKSTGLTGSWGDPVQTWNERLDWKDGAIQNLKGENVATYLGRELVVTEARPLAVYLGSDDGIRGWLNGREVISKDLNRGVMPNQDEVKLDLQTGTNWLVLKIVNYGGGYGFYFATDSRAGDPEYQKIRGWVQMPGSERTAEQAAAIRRYFREREIPEVRQGVADLAALTRREAELDKAIPTIRVMQDLEQGRPSHIRVRGDYRSKGEVVTADVPRSALPPLRSGESLNRLGLARWLVDPKHPLTARVAVNRFWAQCFPQPLVKTANEFGAQGELPSHPELLDWLARSFVEDGWDVKALLRSIVTSATYRQSSVVTPELMARDPENRLLARGPRFRLPAEMVRDNALAVSGLLVEQIGGPSVRPYQPPGLWEEKMFGGNVYEVGRGDQLYRRSLYTLWKRTVPNPTLQTFDAPDRALCTVQRPVTCTPLQAFVTMNDVTFVEASRFFAQRILLEGGTATASRLEFAFRAALARPPTAREQGVLEGLLEQVRREYAADPASAGALVALGQTRSNPALPVGELAAWTGVANVILNLDETVTRE